MTYNDGRFPTGHFGDPEGFFNKLRQAFDYYWEEGATHPKMMPIGLHPRWIGQAGRASAPRDFIVYAQNRDNVWFARRADIARWWIARHHSLPRDHVPAA